MTTIRRSATSALAGALALAAALTPALSAQGPASLPLKAVLVQTPEFCATVFKQGSMWTTGRETLKVGKMACTELEPALKPAFASLTVATAVPPPADGQVVLIPKFVNAHATTAAFAFSNRQMDVLLEWTVKNPEGKTVWLQTVTGTSKHHMGNVFTYAHDVKLIVRDSVKDAAAQSAMKISGAPELRALAAANTPPSK